MTNDNRWHNDDDALQCPVCQRGALLGETGLSNSHLAEGWIDNLSLRVTTEAERSFRTSTSTSANEVRGSQVGWKCWFEQVRARD